MSKVRMQLSSWSVRQARRNRRAASDRGFTLIEAVVVVAILPLVIGAAAAVIIYSERNSAQTQARLSDSVNAQLTAANYVRDVQGATQLTTDAAPPGPVVCGHGSVPAGSTLLLGLNRSGPQPLSVGYWEVRVGTTNVYEVVRYSCVGLSTSQVVVADSVNNATQTAAVIVTPSAAFGNPATGWIPAAATTTVPNATALTGTNDTIPLSSTAGFIFGTPTTPQHLTFLADLGAGTGPFIQETVNCTGGAAGPPGNFTGCSLGSGTIDANSIASQPDAVDSVHLTVMEVASSYTFGLRSTPRELSALTGGNTVGVPGVPPGGGGAGTGSTGSGGGNSCCGAGFNGGPALLTLGPTQGVNIQGGNNSSLTVYGIADVNQGTVACTGAPTMSATSYLATGGSGAIGTCAQGPTTKLNSPTPDPLAGAVPIPFPSVWFGEGGGSAVYSGGTCQSGIWNMALPAGCQLQPGLYVLNGGYCANGSNLSMATGSGANGVLLYVPPGAGACAGGNSANCVGTSVPYSVKLGGNSQIGVPPITPAQANQIFGNTGFAGVVLWQDANNQNNLLLGGTSSGVAQGTIYAPTAQVGLQGNGSGTFGQIIASCVSIAGSTPLVVTGQ